MSAMPFSSQDSGIAKITAFFSARPLTTIDAVLTHLREAGDDGLTDRELARKTALYDSLSKDERCQLMSDLHARNLIDMKDLTGPNGRGRRRVAWVAVQGGSHD